MFNLFHFVQDGDTPLLKAVRNRNFELVQILLEKGAKVSACDKVCSLLVCPGVKGVLLVYLTKINSDL